MSQVKEIELNLASSLLMMFTVNNIIIK